MKSKRLEITDKTGKITAFIELTLDEKGLVVNINGKTTKLKEMERFLTLLEGAFFGILEKETIITNDGYIVFFKGKDRYGVRLGKNFSDEREVIFLRKLAFRELYHWLNLQLIATS